jgi:preprotein translocase subunit SecG
MFTGAPQLPSPPAPPPPPAPFTLGQYILGEVSWGKALGWRARNTRSGEHVINFVKVPLHMERFVSFGHAICADVFLFHFTLLPLRFVHSLAMCVLAILSALLPRRLGDAVAQAVGGGGGSGTSGSGAQQRAAFLTRATLYDLLKGAIIISSTLVLGLVQVSRVYHYIRGEAVIKLYVVFNILEIFDRLCSSLGQDIVDALYRATRDSMDLAASSGGRGGGARAQAKSVLRLLLHLVIAVAYVTFHSCVIFVQIVCLNVAINSRNNALLTLLVSNNFIELKGSVFKRFEAENLFQISCSDAVERFQLSLYLVLIAIQEMTSWAAFRGLAPSMVVIFLAEVCVDYIKHAFISKFNRLHADLYGTFGAILSHDLVSVRQRMSSSLDPTHGCVRRLGLATLPLVCVVLRMVLNSVHPSWFPRLTSFYGVCAMFLFMACLATVKTLVGMVLLSYSAGVITKQKDRLMSAQMEQMHEQRQDQTAHQQDKAAQYRASPRYEREANFAFAEGQTGAEDARWKQQGPAQHAASVKGNSPRMGERSPLVAHEFLMQAAAAAAATAASAGQRQDQSGYGMSTPLQQGLSGHSRQGTAQTEFSQNDDESASHLASGPESRQGVNSATPAISAYKLLASMRRNGMLDGDDFSSIPPMSLHFSASCPDLPPLDELRGTAADMMAMRPNWNGGAEQQGGQPTSGARTPGGWNRQGPGTPTSSGATSGISWKSPINNSNYPSATNTDLVTEAHVPPSIHSPARQSSDPVAFPSGSMGASSTRGVETPTHRGIDSDYGEEAEDDVEPYRESEGYAGSPNGDEADEQAKSPPGIGAGGTYENRLGLIEKINKTKRYSLAGGKAIPM